MDFNQFEPPPFLDVGSLLESSQPQPRVRWLWYAVGAMVLLWLVSAWASGESAQTRQAIDLFSLVILGGLMLSSMMTVRYSIRRHAAAGQMLASVEELLQLRRWEQAGMILQSFLSQPAQSDRLRVQALGYLAGLLARHHRFEDAITVQNYLLDNELVDAASAYGLRLGRAMAMLREDHLVDADRAISDLRRRGDATQSAGLALIEIYRDVKTGHASEAIELFAQRLPVLQRQLGHRLADVHALMAAGYDALGRTAEARAAYQRATILAPALELQRRYPEVAKLGAKFAPTAAPTEAA